MGVRGAERIRAFHFPPMRLPQLGIGISFQATLVDFVFDHADAFDFIEVIPDTLWRDHGRGEQPRYSVDDELAALTQRLAQRKPLVAHSIGLSIGTASRFDEEHVEQLAAWRQRCPLVWHSDHLCAMHAQHHTGREINVGLMMPLPCDAEALELLKRRVNAVQSRVDLPFLLENNTNYFHVPEEEMTEPEFLNRLTHETGCGLLVDLHNLYTNSRNHGFDPYCYLSALDLTQVGEIHLAGGYEAEGLYIDAHDGPCPEALWPMLDWVLARAPQTGGVVYEVFNTNYPDLGPSGLLAQLARAREIWNRHLPHAAS